MSGETKSREFKLDAVHKFLAQDKSAIKFAKTIGVSQTSIANWVREYEETGDVHEPKSKAYRGYKLSAHANCALPPVVGRWVEKQAEKCNITKSEYVRRVLVSMYRKAKAKETA